MTHKIELQVVEFLRSVAKEPLEMEEKLMQPAAKDVGHFLEKLYENDPHKPFTLRLSNVGRPLCQLQMAKKNSAKAESDWFLPLRLMLGGVTEGLTMSILRHAGVTINEEQTKVKLPVNTSNGVVEISGTLDLLIDNKVYDIKSASSYSYAEKFSSYGSLKASDDFGYLGQLYSYAKARDVEAGGFIVIDKSSGEIKVVEVPHNWLEDQEECLNTIEHNVNVIIDEEAEFKRCFEDKDEKFKGKFTGNKMLQSPCTFCEYKYSCWPTLKYIPITSSVAYDKPYRYYTKISD